MDSYTSRTNEIRGGADEINGLAQRLKIGFYFGLWYFLNVVYNSECSSKKIIHALKYFTSFSIICMLILYIICICSFLFGFLEDKIGVKRMLTWTLWSLFFATILAFLAPLLTNFDHLITPKTLFWVAGVIIGLMQGPNQSGSRSLMARLTPDDKKNEFFGFYAFSGKATAFIGPLCFGILTRIFHTQQAGLVIVFLFFLIGIIIFRTLVIEDE